MMEAIELIDLFVLALLVIVVLLFAFFDEYLHARQLKKKFNDLGVKVKVLQSACDRLEQELKDAQVCNEKSYNSIMVAEELIAHLQKSLEERKNALEPVEDLGNVS